MLKKILFSICLITLLALSSSQISLANHRPLNVLPDNSIHASNNLNFNFSISERNSAVTLFNGYSFIFKFDTGAFQANTKVTACSLSIGANSLGTFIASNDLTANTVTCKASNVGLLGTRIDPTATVSVVISGLMFNLNFYNRVRVGLYTSDVNGVLLTSNPGFTNFSVYKDYSTMTDSTAALVLSNIVVNNQTTSLDCQAPCTNLYPWSDFTITFTATVKNYIWQDDVYIIFAIGANTNLAAGIIPTTVTITSATVGDATVQLNKKLSSKATDGSLSLQNMGNGYFYLKSVASYIDAAATTKIFQLVPGRQFSITLSGFNTQTNVSVNALSTIKALVAWQNTMSIISHTNYDLATLTQIKTLSFKTPVANQTTLASTIALNDGSNTEVYENASFPFMFQIRVPKATAGYLKIEHISDASNILSFVASTCDFSANGTTTNNGFGTRPVCVPTYNGYGTSPMNLIKTTSTTPGTSANHSGFTINMNTITGTYQDMILSVWAYTQKCSDASISAQGAVVYNDILNLNNPTSFTLKFQYTYYIGTTPYIQSSGAIDSGIQCFKNVRPTTDQMSTINNFIDGTSTVVPTIVDTYNGTTTTKTDYLIYKEVYEWNPFVPTTISMAESNANTHAMATTYTATGASSKYLSELAPTTTSPIIFSIGTVFTASTSNAYTKLAMPYTQYQDTRVISGAEQPDSSILLQGFFDLHIPTNIVTPVTDLTNCQLVFYGTDTYKAGFQKDYSLASGVYQLTVNSSKNKLTTAEVNGANLQSILEDPFAGSPKVITYPDLNFASNCFNFNAYSNLAVTNIYSHVAFNLKFYRSYTNPTTNSTSHILNRVNRFFKFYNSSLGFLKTNTTTVSNANIQYYFVKSTVAETASNKHLCILEVDYNLFSSIGTNNNTLLITLLSNIIPTIGDGNPVDYYPVSQLASGVNALPLYAEEINDVSNSVTTDAYDSNNPDPFTIDSTSKLVAGYVRDRINPNAPVSYFGSSIVFYGITNKNVTPTNINLYIPVYCRSDSLPFVMVQSFNQSGSGSYNTSSNNIIKLGSTGAFVNYSNTYNGQPNGYTAPTSWVTNVALKFSHYLTASTNSNNLDNMTVTSTTTVAGIYTSILMTYDLSQNSSFSASGSQFFGQSFVSGQYNLFKIFGKTYTGIYFMALNNASQTGLDNKQIQFLTRPAMTTTTEYASLHGFGTVSCASTTNGAPAGSCYSYFSNTSAFVVAEPANPVTVVVPDGSNSMKATITNQGTVYLNDSGANFRIQIQIYSNLTLPATGTSSLSLHSSVGFKSGQTICVDNTNAANICNADANNNVVCSWVGVTAGAFTTVDLSCYNVVIGANGQFVLDTSTTYTNLPYMTERLAANVTADYSANTPPDVSTITPVIGQIEFVHSRNIGGLGGAYLQINLGRSYRIGQTIVLTGPINNLYVGSRTPNCKYMFTDSFSSLETLNFYDSTSKGAWFVNSCTFSSSGNVQSITFNTRWYVPVPATTFSQYILLKLDPVYVVEMKSYQYSIQTYLNADASSKIAAAPPASASQPNFPTLNPAIASTFFTASPQTTTGLCNLKKIYPQLVSAVGEFTFDIDVTNSADFLKTVNTNSTITKVLNEVSIYFDPSVYMMNSNIWCLSGGQSVPCNWDAHGFINFRFVTPLAGKVYSIIVRGVTVPYIDATTNNSPFLCSVNYFSQDVRENLYVGQGSNTLVTFAPKTYGDLISLAHPNGLVSTNVPREVSSYNFRFKIDDSLGLSNVNQTFTANGTGFPTIYIRFPIQYDFSIISAAVTASLTMTDFNTQATNTNFNTAATVNLNNVSQYYNYVIIKIGSNPFTVSANNAYFDLTLNNIPNPWMVVSSPSDIKITLMDDELAPTLMFNTFTNLDSKRGSAVSTASFNDWYNGPSMAFQDNGLALIEPQATTITLSPGRYMYLDFSVSGNNANSAANLSLNSNSVLSAIESKIQLDTGFNSSNYLTIGTSCSTFYGSYLATFSLDSTAGFYKISPIRFNITKGQGYVATINLNTSLLGGDVSTFTLPNGGISTIYAIVTDLPFEDVNISLTTPSNQVNDASFKLSSPANSQNIKAQNTWSYFAYQIAAAPTTSQQITVTSNNRCFGFGSNGSSTRSISFTVSGSVAAISAVNLSQKFQYVQLANNEDQNQLKFIFKAPIPNTRAVFALVCASSNVPSMSNAMSNKALASNVDSKLTYFDVQNYFTTDDVTLIFTNMQRGTSYRLMVWLSNFAIEPTTISANFTSLPLSTNTSNIVNLKTLDIMTKRFVRFDFDTKQSADFINRFLFVAQKYVDGQLTNGAIVASDANGNTLNGYKVILPQDCKSDSGTSMFSASSSAMASSVNSTNSTKNSTTSLRELQTNTTTSNATSTNNTTPAAAQTSWIVLSQPAIDNAIVDIDSLLVKFLTQTSTSTALAAFVNSGTITLAGGVAVNTVSDQALTATSFQLKDFTFNTNGVVTFIPIGPRTLKGYWKLNKVNPASIVHLTPEIIKNCAAPGTGVTTLSCGQITFSLGNTVTTTLNLGTLGEGSYLVDFYVPSDVPQSTNSVSFNNPNVFTVKVEPIPTSSSQNSTASNTTTSSSYISFNFVIFALLLAFLFGN